MERISIAGREIGGDAPCFIIVEAGSNHDGLLRQAERLVDVAAEAGADAVKFQTFTADRIAAQTKASVAHGDFGNAKTLHELYRSVEMPREWLPHLAHYCDTKNIIFLSTPFDEAAVDMLDELGMPAFKISSFELVHLPLLRHTARKGKPVILSTGMATIGEIEEALQAIRGEGNRQVALLHCAINYPAPFATIHLRAMETMRQAFGMPVGYSDHSAGLTVPVAAVARGASVIEKHLTLDKNLPGPDHAFALNPDEFAAMVRAIRDTEAALGSPAKGPIPEEEVHRQRGRRSVFARTVIKSGTVITLDMLSVLRPGVGLMPRYLDVILGRKAQRDIDAHEPITWDCI